MSDKISNKIQILQSQKSSSKFWNITYEQGIFISELISIVKPKNILELGTSNGFSTLWMLKGLSGGDCRITTIEVDCERFDSANRMFKSLNLENVEAICGDLYDKIPKLEGKFDFLFFDAKQAEYLDVFKLLLEHGLVSDSFTLIADNVLSHEQTCEFVEFCEENYTTINVGLGSGMLYVKGKLK